MTRPLAAMEATAGRIAAGDLVGARRHRARRRRRARRASPRRSTRWPSELDASRGHERAFLLSVSHDLRTPLTSIRGYAEAIADGTVDDRGRAAARGRGDRVRVAPTRTTRRRPARPRPARHPPVLARDRGRSTPATSSAEAVDAFRPAATDLGLTLRDRRRGEPLPADRRSPSGSRRSSPTSWRTR